MRSSIFILALALLFFGGAEAKYSPALEIAENGNVTLDGGYLKSAEAITFGTAPASGADSLYDSGGSLYYNSSRISPYVHNVRDAGAIGDESANDWQAIQNCINASRPGEVVFLPNGWYKIYPGLMMRPGVRLVGESLNGTWIEQDPTKPVFSLLYAPYDPSVDRYYMDVSDISFWQNGGGSAPVLNLTGMSYSTFERLAVFKSRTGGAGTAVGVKLGFGSYYNSFANVVVRDCYTGFALNDSANANRFWNCGSRYSKYGFVLNNNSNANAFVGCYHETELTGSISTSIWFGAGTAHNNFLYYRAEDIDYAANFTTSTSDHNTIFEPRMDTTNSYVGTSGSTNNVFDSWWAYWEINGNAISNADWVKVAALAA